MKEYYKTERILAKPMTRGEYNEYRGWDLPDDEDGDEEGYLIEHTDGGARPNIKDHDGYVSWALKHVFESGYQSSTDGMDFRAALMAIKEGKKVARVGWNGKGIWVYWSGSTFFPYSADILADDWYVVE